MKECIIIYIEKLKEISNSFKLSINDSKRIYQKIIRRLKNEHKRD